MDFGCSLSSGLDYTRVFVCQCAYVRTCECI